MYDEEMIAPMRRELSELGVEETRSPEDVDRYLGEEKGATLVVINSVCGCAAANARPAVRMALSHPKKPAKAITVFAGNDVAAAQRVRSYLVGYRPSSPNIALFKDGEVVFNLERHQIEGRSAEAIAQDLKSAFEAYC